MNHIKYQSLQSKTTAKIGANMKLKTILGAAAIAVGLFAGAPAEAQPAASFHSAVGSINNDGELVVAFDERGVGNENIDYTLTADSSAVYACINGGGKHPQASNKETFPAELTVDASFEPKNGRVTASIDAGPPEPDGFTCPKGQRLVLASVKYTNIVLTDTTNGSSTTVADISRIFFNV